MKIDLSDRVKHNSFQVVTVSMLTYACNTRTLKKKKKKKKRKYCERQKENYRIMLMPGYEQMHHRRKMLLDGHLPTNTQTNQNKCVMMGTGGKVRRNDDGYCW